jgi:hypothetical protein
MSASAALWASPVINALDRIDHITVCLEAVSDLVAPETDMHLVDRDKFAILMAFLLTEQRTASNQLAQALKHDS